jgi:hypothetical protein
VKLARAVRLIDESRSATAAGYNKDTMGCGAIDLRLAG